MLDIQYIRENPKEVAEASKNKNVDVDIDELLKIDEERRNLLQETEELRAKKNEVNDVIKSASNDEERQSAIENGKKIKQELEEKEPRLREAQERFDELMYLVPNIPSADTPVGKSEDENQVVRSWGERPEFSFEPKEHFDIADRLGLMDSDRAVKVSGSRFLYLKGDLVLMEWAMMMLGFQTLTNETTLQAIASNAGLSVSSKPFIPILPPMMIRPEMHKRMGRLDPEEMYMLERDNLTLIGSAEHTLGAMYADEVLEEKDLPLRMVGFSSAFRREAGSYGKDMNGMLRLHQFNKMEIESFTVQEDAEKEQEFIIAIQEYLMQQFEIPYQVVAICTGDMGKPDYRQFDIEAWMSGQGKYRETHTSDLIGDFQARRLHTKVRRENGNTEFVHMNDATVFSQRPLIAILENNQQADGSILIPRVLQQWVGKEKIEIKHD
jgi:seryl-tRNA synthetase